MIEFEVEAGGAVDPPLPEPSLRDRLFPSRGFSALEILLLLNLLTGAALMIVWKGNYPTELVRAMRRWHDAIHAPWDAWRMIPTLFLHAGFGHLARNMIGLVAAGAAVEIFYGRRATLAAYFATGITGALFSFFGHARPPLSVGASGAVFGFAGVTLAFLVRFYARFSDRQRWKTRRVYGPMFLILVAPALFQADWYAHVGGFLGGILCGLVMPLDRKGKMHLRPAAPPELMLVEALPVAAEESGGEPPAPPADDPAPADAPAGPPDAPRV